ncbi:hypothetical protein BDW72DRAFT_166247 [Aspergillus terricola var. indicus]
MMASTPLFFLAQLYNAPGRIYVLWKSHMPHLSKQVLILAGSLAFAGVFRIHFILTQVSRALVCRCGRCAFGD